MNEMLTDKTLTKLLQDTLGISVSDSQKVVASISFSEYHDMMRLINDGNTDEIREKVNDILGIHEATVDMSSNNPAPSFNTKPSNLDSPDTTDDEAKIGDTVSISKNGSPELATVTSVDDMKMKVKKGDKEEYIDKKDVKTIDDETANKLNQISKNSEEEIKRILALSGINSDLGENATSGAITSGAIAGILTPMNKIKKRHHVNKKPGPKTGPKSSRKKT